MSRNLAAAALLLFALPLVDARAQMRLGVAAGLTAPSGDFNRIVDDGFHVGGFLTFAPPLAPLALRAEGSFSEFKYAGPIGANGAKARIVSGTANAVLKLPGIVGPYAIAGLGIYRLTSECDGCTASTTKGGVNGGAGFQIGLGTLSAFVEARFHYIPGPSDATTAGLRNTSTRLIPISVGLTF
jgi:hypothetical protein